MRPGSQVVLPSVRPWPLDHGGQRGLRVGIVGTRSLDPALPLPGALGLSLRWVADGPLASTLLRVLAENPWPGQDARPQSGDLYLAFANTLSSRAGIDETARLRAALDYPVTDVLRDLETTQPRTGDGVLVENRSKGEATTGESIILALA